MKPKYRRKHLRILLMSAICAMAISAIGVSSAEAITVQRYFLGYIAGGGHADGPRHTLASNVASSGGGQVCVGQLNSSGNWVGGYDCGTPNVVKYYCVCALYYPRVHNGQGYTQAIAADSTW
jgi:hypothetical protein